MFATSPKKISFSVIQFQENLLTWYRLNKAQHLWRQLWESRKDPYPVWVSEIMLQQTTIASMSPVFEKFITRFPTMLSLSSSQEQDIRTTVQGLGYYRRFSLLYKGVKTVVASKHLPNSYEQWLEIPGVGDYTAAALSSITLGEAVPVIDGNVIRVLCRLFDLRQPANDPSLKKELKNLAFQLIDKTCPGDFNQGMMELGQKVCRPSSPSCQTCPLKSFCLAYKHKSIDLAPAPKLKKSNIDVNIRLHVVEDGDFFVLWERSERAKFLKKTVGFLTQIKNSDSFYVDGLETEEIFHQKYIGKVKHSITHHRITAEVYKMELSHLKAHKLLIKEARRVKKKQLLSHLVSSLDIKAWELYHRNRFKKTLFD